MFCFKSTTFDTDTLNESPFFCAVGGSAYRDI